MPMMRKYFAYKVQNQGRTVYVGITEDMGRRLRQHSRKSWFSKDLQIVFAEMPDKETAKMLETYLIKTLHPAFNKKENTGSSVSFMSLDNSRIDWQNFSEYVSPSTQERIKENENEQEKFIELMKRNRGDVIDVTWKNNGMVYIVFNEKIKDFSLGGNPFMIVGECSFHRILSSAEYRDGKMILGFIRSKKTEKYIRLVMEAVAGHCDTPCCANITGNKRAQPK